MVEKLRIIVAGMVGQYPLGGVAWDYFQYLLGLHELGHDVYYHEDTWCWPFDPLAGSVTDRATYSAGFIAGFFSRHGPYLAARWHFQLLHGQSFGMTRAAFNAVAATADVFLNVSGASFIPAALSPRCKRVFVDTDPGWNQIRLIDRPAWSEHVDQWASLVRSHDVHLSYGVNIGQPHCLVPVANIRWRPAWPVVHLPSWAAARDSPPPADAPFGTMMTWDYFGGPLTHGARTFAGKPAAFEPFAKLPAAAGLPLTLAIGGTRFPGEELRATGWALHDGHAVSRSPASYQHFIAGLRGEWSVAKDVYTATRSGWFSGRTACFLASGRPAVVEDTGWSQHLPTGLGLHRFATMEDAVNALQTAAENPDAERAAAYDIARQHFAADLVLPAMLDGIFAT